MLMKQGNFNVNLNLLVQKLYLEDAQWSFLTSG